MHVTTFHYVLRALILPWACNQQADGDVVIKAIDQHETRRAIEDCSTIIEYNQNCFKGQEEIYPDVFMDLWPGNESWWEGWTSIPLDLP